MATVHEPCLPASFLIGISSPPDGIILFDMYLYQEPSVELCLSLSHITLIRVVEPPSLMVPSDIIVLVCCISAGNVGSGSQLRLSRALSES